MAKHTQIYPLETVYHLGAGDESLCCYDFSLIPSKTYEPLFNSLPNLIYKKVDKIIFCNDLHYKYEQSRRHNIKKENCIKNSIFYDHPKYIDYLAKIIYRTLPDSKRLRSLQFSNIEISSKLLRIIFKAIGKCKTLESVVFQNVKVGDELFQMLLDLINPYQFVEVVFTNCGLTSASFNAAKEFIMRRPLTLNIERQLRVFNVDDNSFPVDELNIIEDLVNDAAADHTQTIDLEEEEEESDEPIQNVSSDSEEPQNKIPRQQRVYPKLASEDSESEEDEEEEDDEEVRRRLQEKYKPEPQEEYYSDDEPDEPQVLPHRRGIASESAASEDSFEEEEDFDFEAEDPEDLSNEELRDEISRLDRLLKTLLRKKNAAIYGDDVFILGEGAQELVEVVRNMEDQIASFKEIEEQNKSFR